MSKFDEASKLLEASMKIRKSQAQVNQGELAESSIQLGYLSFMKGEYVKALVFYKDAEAILLTEYGEDHQKIRFLYLKLGNVYLKLGDCATATTYFSKSLEIYSKLVQEEKFVDFTFLFNFLNANLTICETFVVFP